ncbi:MAG: ribosome-associated translation inhibitor RaiA [Patescibacteria group bacterium]
MKINLQGTNIELTGAIRDYVTEKLVVVGKFFESSAATDEPLAEVEVGKTSQHHKHGIVYRAEINLRWSGQYFRAEATASDLYPAIDEAKDELLREIKTRRQKQGTRLRRGGRLIKNFLRGIYHRKEKY